MTLTDYEKNTLRAIAGAGPEGAQWDEGSANREAALQRLCEAGYVTVYIQRAADDSGLVRTVVVTGEGLGALRGEQDLVDPATVLAIRLHDIGHAVRADDLRALALLLAMDDDARLLYLLYVRAVQERAKAKAA